MRPLRIERRPSPWSAVQALWHRLGLRALERSPSIVHLLYLPAPESPVPALRPRSAPTALRPFDPLALARGVTLLRGRAVALEPPLPWRPAEAETGAPLLHEGEEVLALARLGRAHGKPEPLRLARAMVADWIAQNPPGSMPGWEPQVLARRVSCWSAAVVESGAGIPAEELQEWLVSLHLQARFLASNLERHEHGLHLLAELRALLAAGALLTGTETRRWSEVGAALLQREVLRQINPDGGHACRTPAGHLRALADLVDALELLPPEAPAARLTRERLPYMVRFACALAHPDGGPAAFGGAFRDRSPALLDVLAGARLAPPALPAALTFAQTGFSSFPQTEAGDALVVDWVGPPSGGTEPGAAGSFEASYGGERFVVTPLLTSPEARDRAHNSVVSPGARSERPRLEEVVWGEGPGFAYLGLDLRARRVRQTRRFLVFASRAAVVLDTVRGAEAVVESLLHLDAGVRILEAGERRLFLEKGETTVTLAWSPGSEAAVAEGIVLGPGGELRKAPVLRMSATRAADGTQRVGYLLAAGRRRDAALELLLTPDERLALRFDPRRYLIRWEPGSGPRLLLAD